MNVLHTHTQRFFFSTIYAVKVILTTTETHQTGENGHEQEPRRYGIVQ